MKNNFLLVVSILVFTSLNAQEVKLMTVMNSIQQNHPKLTHWKSAGVSITGRQDTYIAIVSEPAKDKVKRVVFIAAGQQSESPVVLSHINYGDGYTNVLTGQPDNYKFGLRGTPLLEANRTLNPKSLASRLINSGEFPKESTLFVLAFDARFGYFRKEHKKKRRENAFYNFLTSKFDASKVEVIVLAGQSRGGALMFRLGSRLRSNSVYAKIPLIVQGYDPVATNPILVKTNGFNLNVVLPNTPIEQYLPINSKNDIFRNPHDHKKYCWKVDLNVTFPPALRGNLKVLNLHAGGKVGLHNSIRAFAWTGENTINPTWYKEWWLNFGHEEMGGCSNFNDSDCLYKTVEVGYQHIIYSIPKFTYKIKEKVYSYHTKPVVGNFNADYVDVELATVDKGVIRKKDALKRTIIGGAPRGASRNKRALKGAKIKTIKGTSIKKTTLNKVEIRNIVKKKPIGLVRKNYSDIVYYGKCGEGDECWRTHLNDTNGKFTTTSYGSNMWFEGDKPIHTPLAGDFNKDGYTDIAYYGRCDDGKKCWRVHLNDTNGKFTTTSYGGNIWFEGDKPIHTPLAGDFNKDGYTDIAYYGKCDDGKKCWRVHLNDKNGKFTITSYGDSMWFEGDKPINAPVAGDFNKDGYTDIAYYGKCDDGKKCWRVHLNDKNGKFTTTSYGDNMWFEGDKPINAPVAGDFNKDGYTDIAYYGKCDDGKKCWRVHLNDTNGKFTTTSYGGGMWFEGDEPLNAPVAGDFNHDGYTDIAYYGKCGDGEGCWRVHLNDKKGGFTVTSFGGNMWFKD